MVMVIKHQFDAGLPHGLAATRTVENNVGHALAAQVLRRALSHNPPNRVDHVGLAATVGAYDRAEIRWEIDRCRIDKGLKARELDTFEAH